MFSEMFFWEIFLEFQGLFGEVFQLVSEEDGLGRGEGEEGRNGGEDVVEWGRKRKIFASSFGGQGIELNL